MTEVYLTAHQSKRHAPLIHRHLILPDIPTANSVLMAT